MNNIARLRKADTSYTLWCGTCLDIRIEGMISLYSVEWLIDQGCMTIKLEIYLFVMNQQYLKTTHISFLIENRYFECINCIFYIIHLYFIKDLKLLTSKYLDLSPASKKIMHTWLEGIFFLSLLERLNIFQHRECPRYHAH